MLLFADGTPYDPPENPLKEKWEKLYPSCRACGYNCMYCGKCPHGDYWKVPVKDRDAYMEWKQEYDAYMEANKHHGELMFVDEEGLVDVTGVSQN